MRGRKAVMARRLTHDLEFRRLAFCLGTCLFASTASLARANGMTHYPATHQTVEAKEAETTMRGCLGGRPEGGFYYLVADDGGYFYVLHGNTSLLKGYVGKEISLRGKETDAVAPSRFEIASFGQIFDAPCPTLKPSFSRAAWQTERNREYGIEFSYPDDFALTPVTESGQFLGNFVTDQGVVPVARLSIPGGVYPNSNFGGGSFTISVNTEIGNGASCRQFGFSDPRFASSHAFHGIQYAEMVRTSGAAGTIYSNYQFHTLQNGLCYEIAFEFSEANPGNIERRIRVLRDIDESNLIQALIARVEFSIPTVAVAREGNPQAVPRITRFVASSQTADDVANRGQITFSWATQHADYVEISYKCIPPMAGDVPAAVILEDHGYPAGCNNTSPLFKNTTVEYRASNSSQTIAFGNNRRLDPITIVVELTPFAYGKAYPDSAKSISIQVNAHNPFPEGVPTPDGKIVLSYPVHADGTTKLQQGSSLTIHWTNANPRDACVNLYLIQDVVTGKQIYRMQLGDKCFAPASSSSYTWTIPDRYSGGGFRIYSGAPGGTASGLGAHFSIVPWTVER